MACQPSLTSNVRVNCSDEVYGDRVLGHPLRDVINAAEPLAGSPRADEDCIVGSVLVDDLGEQSGCFLVRL